MTDNYIKKLKLGRPIGGESYLRSLPAVRYLMNGGELSFDRRVTFFVGENGTGKSTLIEAIAVAFGFNPVGGSRNFTFHTKDSHSELGGLIDLAKGEAPRDGFFLRAESLYNVATNIDEMDESPSFDPPVIDGYGGVSLHELSHGESFLAVVRNRFFGKGLYILDEPEAALSPMRTLNLMVLMDKLVKNDSQFIIATHSPMLIAFPNAAVYEFSASGIDRIDYARSEHFRTMKAFLDSPERMIGMMLDEDEKDD